jgi:hypothetical protein
LCCLVELKWLITNSVKLLLLYLTAKSGLSESEMEDILACDDDVLNDVYTYWTPPLRRLPPLLLLRLKADLREYIGKFQNSLGNILSVADLERGRAPFLLQI